MTINKLSGLSPETNQSGIYTKSSNKKFGNIEVAKEEYTGGTKTAFWGSLLNNLNRLGHDVQGMIKQNDAKKMEDVWNENASEITSDLNAMYESPWDLAQDKEDFDAKWEEVANSAGLSETEKTMFKTKLNNFVEPKMGSIYVNATNENIKANMNNLMTDLDTFVSEEDRAGGYRRIQEAVNNRVLEKKAGEELGKSFSKNVNYEILKNDLGAMDYEKAHTMLSSRGEDSDRYKYFELLTSEEKTTLEKLKAQKSMLGEKEAETLNDLQKREAGALTEKQRESIEDFIYNKELQKKNVIALNYSLDVAKLAEDITKEDFNREDFKKGKDYPGIPKEKRLALLRTFEQDSRDQETIAQAEAKNRLQHLGEDGTLTKAMLDDPNSGLSAAGRTYLRKEYFPQTGNKDTPWEIAKKTSAETLAWAKLLYYDTGDAAKARAVFATKIGTQGPGEPPSVMPDDIEEFETFLNDQDPIITNEISKALTNGLLKDDPAGQIIVRENLLNALDGTETGAIRAKMVESMTALYQKEEITEELKKSLKKNVNGIWFGGTNSMETSIEYLNSGMLMGMRAHDPETWEVWSQHLQDQYEVINKEEYKGEIRFHNGYIPVFKVDNVDMIIDVKKGKPFMSTLEDALKVHKNLALDIPVGTKQGYLTTDENGKTIDTREIMTQSGWIPLGNKKMMEEREVDGAVVYRVLDSKGDPSEDGMAYIVTNDWTGQNVIFVPTYLDDFNDDVSIANKIKIIQTKPDSAKTKKVLEAEAAMQRREDALKRYDYYISPGANRTSIRDFSR